MNGEAAARGISGRIFIAQAAVSLTVEPTNPGDTWAEMWVAEGAYEMSPSLRFGPDALELLADDLLSRAAMLRYGPPVEAEVLDAEDPS